MPLMNVGQTEAGEPVMIDLDREGMRFILLAGKTGSGKSVFHAHLYHELMRLSSPAELGFVVLDMTRLEFAEWDQRYLVRPVVHDADEALRVLEEIAGSEAGKRIVIHIEECDMVYLDRPRMEAALDRLKERSDILVVYSTSRIDPSYLKDWLEKYVDMKVIFRVAAAEDSVLLLGSDAALSLTLPGERILAFNGKVIKYVPFDTL